MTTARLILDQPHNGTQGNITNISMFGMRVEFTTRIDCAPGDVLHVRFLLPGCEEVIHTQLEVARKESPHIYGFKFIRLCSSVVEHIRKHLAGQPT